VKPGSVTTFWERLQGFQVTQLLHVAATLRLPDLLADGPRPAVELASATGTHADSLVRLLRALAQWDIVEETAAGRFGLAPMGQLLRTDVPESLHAFAVLYGQAWYAGSWELLHSVRTGEVGFAQATGQDFFAFLADHPEASTAFDGAMASGSGGQGALRAYDFSGLELVVDIGGGTGRMLAAALRSNPDMRGILFELPHAAARAAEELTAAGLMDRCTIVPGDLTHDPLPPGDAYILGRIIHSFDDESAGAILRACRRAARPQARVLLVERVIGVTSDGPLTALADLQMMVLRGGKERTEQEYGRLLHGAGFRLNRIAPQDAPWQVIEGISIDEGF
jgi:hypothetical protein